MKRSLALFFLILLCNRIGFSQLELGQFYDGDAKPRSDVAWIWTSKNFLCDQDVVIERIDQLQFRVRDHSRFYPPCVMAVEVLPGNHVFTLTYSGWNAYSLKNLEVPIVAKAGENYYVDRRVSYGRNGIGTWEASVSRFSPEEKHVSKLKRTILERSLSVEGVVQSWKFPNLVLTLPGNASTREFRYFMPGGIPDSVKLPWVRLQTGQEVKVFYFPSSPNTAEKVYLKE
jgi:hypothetical protein